MRAAVKGVDRGVEFCEGHELDVASAALVPEHGDRPLAQPGRSRQADPAETAGGGISAARRQA